MNKIIKCIYASISYDDGNTVNELLSGDESNLNIYFEDDSDFKFGRRMVGKKTYIVYEDGSISNLNVENYFYANVFKSDGSILVVFYEEKYFSSGDYFSPPNNAAIYNSDGSLRHQLVVPEQYQQQGWYIHSTYYTDFPHLKGFGVMVTNDHHWPELCFCLYDGTPNLVWTGYQQERR